MLLTQIKCGSAPPLLRNDLLQSFKCLTLDCETYLSNNKQNLMSVATFDGKVSKFYFIGDYKEAQSASVAAQPSPKLLIKDLILIVLNIILLF